MWEIVYNSGCPNCLSTSFSVFFIRIKSAISDSLFLSIIILLLSIPKVLFMGVLNCMCEWKPEPKEIQVSTTLQVFKDEDENSCRADGFGGIRADWCPKCVSSVCQALVTF